MTDKPYQPETTAVHTAPPDPASGAVIPPLTFSTTFAYTPTGTPHDGSHFIYTRNENPNRAMLEAAVAALEGGVVAHAVSSGSAAMMTVFTALRPGDHIVCSDDLYFGIRVQLNEFFAPWGIETTYVDTREPANVAAAMRPETALVLFESPTNPQIRLADIAAIAEIAHAGGALMLVDNTIATPVSQQPLALGADISVLSMTKYMAGHHDVLGGVIVLKDADSEFSRRIMRLVKIGGAVLSPMDCWLALRGLQTLPYRVRAHSANALAVANFLAAHPAVERVLYPHHPSHPQYNLAQRQMRVGGGLLSVQVAGGRAAALDVVRRLKLFTSATSFGGTHSLIEHRESVEENSTTPPNLLRVSVGLEHADDLIADFAQALGTLG
jgi:cystathionine gamma-synthase